jgi:hypothetical protein
VRSERGKESDREGQRGRGGEGGGERERARERELIRNDTPQQRAVLQS